MKAENEKDPEIQAFERRSIENVREEFERVGIQMPEKFGVSFVSLHRQLEDSKYLKYIRRARRRRNIGSFLVIANNQTELSIARSISEILTEKDYYWTKVAEFSRWDRLKGILQRRYVPAGLAILVPPGYPRTMLEAIIRSF